MEISIQLTVLQKVLLNNFKLNLPEETFFFRKENYHSVIMVKPGILNFDKDKGVNQLYYYDVVKVTQNPGNIRRVTLSVCELEAILSRDGVKHTSEEDFIKREVVLYIKDFFGEDFITEESFKKIYKDTLKNFSEIID